MARRKSRSPKSHKTKYGGKRHSRRKTIGGKRRKSKKQK